MSFNSYYKNCWRLILAQLISTAGDQLTTIATFGFLLDKTGNPIQASLSLVVKGVVNLLFGLVSMKILDRVSPKRLMIAGDILRFGFLAMLVLLPNVDIKIVLLIQALLCIVEIFFNSARETLFCRVLNNLPGQDQVRLMTYDNQAARVMEIAGYGLSFIIISGVNYHVAYLIDGCTFLASAALVLLISESDSHHQNFENPSSGSILDGILAVVDSPALMRSTITRAVFWLAAGIFNMLMLKVATDSVTSMKPNAVIAIWDSVLSLGMFVGLKLAERRAEKSNLFLFCGGGNFILALATFVFVQFRDLSILGITMLFYGLGMGLNSFGMRRIRQLASQEIVRGRVIAFTNMVAKVAEILGMGFVILSANSNQQLLLWSGLLMLLSSAIAIGSLRVNPSVPYVRLYKCIEMPLPKTVVDSNL